jgi:hypothetical protein
MRKSDILAGPCQGGPWAARTLSSTNGLVWVPDVSLGCYHFLFETGVWQWRDGDTNGQSSPFAGARANGNGADVPFEAVSARGCDKVLATAEE